MRMAMKKVFLRARPLMLIQYGKKDMITVITVVSLLLGRQSLHLLYLKAKVNQQRRSPCCNRKHSLHPL